GFIPLSRGIRFFVICGHRRAPTEAARVDVAASCCSSRRLAIRCNSIHPGAIRTPMWEPMLGEGPERPAREAAIVADTPLRRFGEPEEVAALAVMLASDEAAYMTGAELSIDGGILAGSAAPPGG
ncbi:MAG: SDR family oxidoreductase, partial [Pseudomonadota bacterium]